MLPKLENSNNITAIEEEIQILKNLLNTATQNMIFLCSTFINQYYRRRRPSIPSQPTK